MRSPELQKAIDEVYAEFRAPKPRAIDGCPCCTSPKDLCHLLEKPLKDLSADDLREYGSSAFLTMGGEQDFKYFLPRLLDIASAQDWWPSPEIVLGKLRLGRWNDWPDRQRSAVKRVIDAWFADCLNDSDRADGSEIDQLLCGIARADLPIAEYLEALSKRPLELLFFVDVHEARLAMKKRLANEFWKDVPAAAATVIDFIKSAQSQS
jgi:hypothetical protein